MRLAKKVVLFLACGGIISCNVVALPALRADQPAATAPAPEPLTLAAVCKHTRVTKGAIIGALAGFGIGMLTGQRGGSLIGTTLAGGVVGGAIGAHFDKKACDESMKAQQAALQTGETQQWASDDGKTRYTYAVDRHYLGDIPVNRDLPVTDGRVVDLSDLADVRGTYEVTDPVANVREAPRLAATSHIVDTYKRGDRLAVLGETTAGTWLLVSRDGKSADGWAKAKSLHAVSNDLTSLSAPTAQGRTFSVKRVALHPACIVGHEQFTADGKDQTGASFDRCRDETGTFAATAPATPTAKG